MTRIRLVKPVDHVRCDACGIEVDADARPLNGPHWYYLDLKLICASGWLPWDAPIPRDACSPACLVTIIHQAANVIGDVARAAQAKGGVL